MRLKDKICIVTGANTGIGKEIARDLARLGADVTLACRSAAPTSMKAIRVSAMKTDRFWGRASSSPPQRKPA